MCLNQGNPDGDSEEEETKSNPGSDRKTLCSFRTSNHVFPPRFMFETHDNNSTMLSLLQGSRKQLNEGLALLSLEEKTRQI